MNINPKDNEYLFVCGCARSGTSTITDLLRSHSQIVIGRERYNSLYKSNIQLFNKSLFTKERFCNNLLPGDTHHVELNDYYKKIDHNWEQSRYYGDKIPSLFKNYNHLFQTFGQCKIIFLLRNIIDVCQSWEVRKLDSIKNKGKWPFDRGYKACIREWNMSLDTTLNAIEKYPRQILLIQYEDLYTDDNLLKIIFDFLELEINTEVKPFWTQNKAKRDLLEQNRTIHLSSNQKRFICSNANFIAYNRLKDLQT